MNKFNVYELLQLQIEPQESVRVVSLAKAYEAENFNNNPVCESADKFDCIRRLIASLYDDLGDVSLLLNYRKKAEDNFTRALSFGSYPQAKSYYSPLKMLHHAHFLNLNIYNRLVSDFRPIKLQSYFAKAESSLKSFMEEVLNNDELLSNKNSVFDFGIILLSLSKWVAESSNDKILLKRARKLKKLIQKMPDFTLQSHDYMSLIKGLIDIKQSGVINICLSEIEFEKLKLEFFKKSNDLSSLSGNIRKAYLKHAFLSFYLLELCDRNAASWLAVIEEYIEHSISYNNPKEAISSIELISDYTSLLRDFNYTPSPKTYALLEEAYCILLCLWDDVGFKDDLIISKYSSFTMVKFISIALWLGVVSSEKINQVIEVAKKTIDIYISILEHDPLFNFKENNSSLYLSHQNFYNEMKEIVQFSQLTDYYEKKIIVNESLSLHYFNDEFASKEYWESRYKGGGNSGAGSYGRLAEFKAEIINEFIEKNSINKVIEFGCGDGNQLGMLKVAKYIGVDVSQTAISICRDKFFDKRNLSLC